MQTITFYSYKGGVGRTLVVANVAKYLSRFGQSVFAMDLDLEAPGLLYKFADAKFENNDGNPQQRGQSGFVDYLYRFAIERRELPKSIEDYVVNIPVARDTGAIRILNPGAVPSQDYWRKLAAISWHELFYSADPVGIPFFLNLKETIADEFNPDFLLIDSRTGVTEIGGVATTVLPDKVVCLLVNNKENLEGAREVLRTVRGTNLLPEKAGIEIIPVLTRVPRTQDTEHENVLLREIKQFLNEPSATLSNTLNIDEVFILHSDRDLELRESLRIGGDKTLDESELLRDYLRLFTKLIPRNVIEPFIEPLVNAALIRLLDEPKIVQQELEAIAISYPHPVAFKRLLQLYQLRHADDDIILKLAERYWEISRGETDPIVWQVVRDRFSAKTIAERPLSYSLTFIEAVWRKYGELDPHVGLELAECYRKFKDPRKARNVLESIVMGENADANAVVTYLDLLVQASEYRPALKVINDFKLAMGDYPKFSILWANVILTLKSIGDIEEFLSSISATEVVAEHEPSLFARLLEAANHKAALYDFAERSLDRLVHEGPSRRLEEVGRIYESLGRFDEFISRLRMEMNHETVEDFVRLIRHRPSDWRFRKS